jgi:hypothetical protein
MKKIIFLMLCLFIVAGTASAQRRYPQRGGWRRGRGHAQNQRRQDNNNENRPRFLVIAGANISNVVKDNDPDFTTDAKAGLNIGAGLILPIVNGVAFQPELMYSNKGYKAVTPYGEFTQRSNYIDLPLLLRLTPTPGFHLLVGPQVSFLLSTENVYNNGFTTTTQTQYNSATDGYNKSLLSGVLGLSVDLGPNAELRGRYNIDLQSNNNNGTSYLPQYRNQLWQIGIGFKF